MKYPFFFPVSENRKRSLQSVSFSCTAAIIGRMAHRFTAIQQIFKGLFTSMAAKNLVQ
jgi:hypothetical protein